MKIKEPIHKRIEKEISERILFLKSKIDDFVTPITNEDYKDNFKSRLTGVKSSKALREHFNELLQREGELELIINYDMFYQRNKKVVRNHNNL